MVTRNISLKFVLENGFFMQVLTVMALNVKQMFFTLATPEILYYL